MVNLCFDFYLEMPVWVHDFATKLSDKIESVENRMKIIIELSRLNMQNIL